MADKKKPKIKVNIYEQQEYIPLPGEVEAVQGMGGRARWAPVTSFSDVKRLQPARTIYDMSDEPFVVEPSQETIWEIIDREMRGMPTRSPGSKAKLARWNRESGTLEPIVRYSAKR